MTKNNDFLNRNLKDCIFLRKHFSGKLHKGMSTYFLIGELLTFKTGPPCRVLLTAFKLYKKKSFLFCFWIWAIFEKLEKNTKY